jgi:hypothetical protein
MKITSLIILNLLSLNLIANSKSEKEIRDDIIDFQYYLIELDKTAQRHYDLINNWVLKDKSDSSELKLELLSYLDSNVIFQQYDKLMDKRYFLTNELIMKLVEMSGLIQNIAQESRYITNVLNSKDAYDDPFLVFEVQPKVEPGGSIHLAALEIKNNIKLLYDYSDFLNEQKKVKSLVEINQQAQSKYNLIVDLFELCNLRVEIDDYLTKLSSRGYWYLDSEKELIETGIYERLLKHYYNLLDIKDLNKLIDFYKSDIGVKILESNGFISLKLFESVLDKENN